MKNAIILFILICVSACGSKSAGSKTKFKLFSGSLMASSSVFPGGLLVLGRSMDGGQSFVTVYTSGMELELKKGPWEFATVGWMGANKMEGMQQCSFQTADLNTDSMSLTFDMTYAKCFTDSTMESKQFSNPLFYNYFGGTYNGFKTLDVKVCSDINSCSDQSAPGSFRVMVLPRNEGMMSKSQPLISNCIDGYSSNITPPHGGTNGFIGMKVETYSGTSCTGTMKEYFYDHGIGEKLDRTFVDMFGVTQTRRSALSPDMNASTSSLALQALKYYGVWTSTSTMPSAPNTGDLYHYRGGMTSSVTPNAPDESYIYYNGSTWSTFPYGAAVKLFVEAY